MSTLDMTNINIQIYKYTYGNNKNIPALKNNALQFVGVIMHQYAYGD